MRTAGLVLVALWGCKGKVPGAEPHGDDPSTFDTDDTVSRDDDDDTAPFAAQGMCVADGWCWEHPLPQGNPLESVASLGPSDAFAIAAGAFLVWDGTSWSGHPLEVDPFWPGVGDLRAFAPDDVWAIHSYTIYHWDGTAVTPVTDGFLPFRLAGLGPADLVAIDQLGTVYRPDGADWVTTSPPTPLGTRALRDVWTSPSGTIYGLAIDQGVEYQPSLFRLDGDAWTPLAQTGLQGFALGGLDDDLVWVGGQWGIHAWDGAAWSLALDTYVPPTGPILMSIEDISEVDGGTAWAVGSDEGFHHWDGIGWTTSQYVEWGHTVRRVQAPWAVGDAGRIWSLTGGTWTPQVDVPPLYSVTATTSGDETLIFDGDLVVSVEAGRATWGELPSGNVFSAEAAACTAPETGDVWVIEHEGELHRRSGGSWSAVGQLAIQGLPTAMAASNGTLWVVTDAGEIVVRESGGGGQTFSPAGGPLLTDVWFAGPDEVWVVGWGLVLTGDSTGLTPLPTPIAANWYAVHGTGPDDVWLGSSSSVLHWDGAGFTEVEALEGYGALDLLALGPEEVYAQAINGTSVARFDGVDWTLTEVPVAGGILTATPSTVRLVVYGGSVLARAREVARDGVP